MELEYKPDLDRAKTYWNAFWNREIIDRPCAYVIAPKDEAMRKERPPHPPYMAGYDGQYQKALEAFDEWAASTYFGGEAVPFFDISFGPDQFSAFLGAELKTAEAEKTSWVKPFVADWKSVRIGLDRGDGSAWDRMLEYMRAAARFSEGKFLIGMLDLHSNMDSLSAIRGPEALCTDLIECPDEVERVLREVRALYAPVYEGIYEAGGMGLRGTIGWTPFYCEGRFATIQCDFICMISPEHARRFVIPALSEEASFLDHSVYHYDGPAALVHLDDILAIPEIDVIQWVPGAGSPPLVEWMDLLKKIQEAKKGLQIYDCSPEEVKAFHKELRPEGVLYCVSASSRQEADDLILWLKKNT
jgi:hypothetical protein